MWTWKHLFRSALRLTLGASLSALLAWTFAASAFAVQAESFSIQDVIDHAPPYAEVVIPAGTYQESVVISKPLRLFGQGQVTLTAEKGKPAITVTGKNVQLFGLHLVQPEVGKQLPALYAEGEGHLFRQLHIESRGAGMILEHVSQVAVVENVISGEERFSPGERGHGVEIWFAHDVTAQGNEIQGVQDGFYVEKSSRIALEENRIRHSRYGIHLMFTQDVLVRGNRSEQNISGAMVMGTERSAVVENQFLWNYFHVNAMGLLLYDERQTEVSRNLIANNLIGLYVQDSRENLIQHNYVLGNVIGLQLHGAEGNDLYHNLILGNVMAGQARGSDQNHLYANYWDTLGIDFDGDGYSDLPFTADPYLLTILQHHPAFQLLVEAPGLPFLQQLLAADAKGGLKDDKPLVTPEPLLQEAPLFTSEGDPEGKLSAPASPLSSLLLVGLALIIIFIGGWRR